jgi:Meckel syndrome type 1 protein
MSKSYLRTSSAPSGLVLFSLAGLVALTTSPAVAKSKPDAGAVASADEESNDPCLLDGLCRAHYLRARNLSRDGNFDGALAAYEAAYRRRPVPWLLISIGRTLHKLGRPADAIKQYERYRQDDKNPNPTRLERVAEYTKQAESDLAAAPKPAPPVAANPPAPVTPPPAGGTPPNPSSDPNAGKTAQVPSDTTAGGSKTPPAPVGTAPTGKSPEPLVARASAAGEPGSAATAPSPSRWKWNGLWAGLGVSGGFLLLGGALGIAAQASSSQLRGTNYVGSNPTPDVVALQDRIRGLAVAADTFFVATAVSVGVTLALTLTRKPTAEPRPSRQLPGLEDLGPPPAAVSPTPAPTAVSAPAPAAAPAKPEPSASPVPASKPEPASTPPGAAKPEGLQAPAVPSKPASETVTPASPAAQSGSNPGAAAPGGAAATAPSGSPAAAATAASPSPAPATAPSEGSRPATQTSPPSAPGAP